MNDKEYRKTVIRLRTHQDGWFRFHNRADLIASKQLEKLIDNENKRWLEEEASSVMTEPEYQTQMELGEKRFPDESDAGDLLDRLGE